MRIRESIKVGIGTRNIVGNGLGAFADGAVLFPMLLSLSLSTGMAVSTLCFCTGSAYLAAAYLFRIPMPVQPLKAVAMAAITLGAYATEVRLAGACLGALCLGLALSPAHRLLARVPRHYIHGVQLSLGLLLIIKGCEYAWAARLPDYVSTWVAHVPDFVSVWAVTAGITMPELTKLLLIAALGGIAYLLVRLKQVGPIPLLGLFAVGSFIYMLLASHLGLALSLASSSVVAEAPASGSLRPAVVASLVLPQLILTSANSVLGTIDGAQRYFGERAARVTIKRLFLSIGLGNLIQASVGGLPFCHGAGGLTAHVRGGSDHWRSNVVIGLTLYGLALAAALAPNTVLRVEPYSLAVLLISIGYFHAQLAQASWLQSCHRLPLLIMALTTLYSQNILLALIAGCLSDGARYIVQQAMAWQAERRRLSQPRLAQAEHPDVAPKR